MYATSRRGVGWVEHVHALDEKSTDFSASHDSQNLVATPLVKRLKAKA